MSDTQTLRHQLPLLIVAQAQKELTHNEALTRIDALLHPVIEDRLAAAPTLALVDTGKCWLIDEGSTGIWAGKAGQIALWTGGSWRYLEAVVGMRIRNVATGSDLIQSGTTWHDAPTIDNPQSGAVIDTEARAAIASLLGHFRNTGQLAS